MAGIYIHVPFCKQACSYCDFYFVTREDQIEQYVSALITQIQTYRDTPQAVEKIETIYFGGGTPSRLSAGRLESILDQLEDTFDLNVKELTLEMNPDDVNREYLKQLHGLGFDRVSMGVQSFDQDLLTFMNRSHTAEESRKCMDLLQRSEFNVFTVDLIYGNPGQSLEILNNDLDELLTFNPPHLSAYSLTIEEGTRLGKLDKLGRLNPLEDELVERHFDLVANRLNDAGMIQYEVSNFARPGKEALHNSNYWDHVNYLGLGPSAHSFWWDNSQTSAQRWESERDLKRFIDSGGKRISVDELNRSDLAEERIMLGLRTRKGISEKDLSDRYDYLLNNRQKEYIEKKESSGFINRSEERIHLTRNGLKIADSLILDILTLRE